MRIQTKTSVDFQIPADFEAELTRYNVLLSDVGEQTTPLTLPGTPHNLQLIGYSNRLDNYYKPISEMEVLVSDGLFVRPCNMVIHSADETDGISVTLYLATGDFYSFVGEKMMSQLAWPVIQHPTSKDRLVKVKYLISLLKTQYITPNAECIFHLRPVVTNLKYNYKYNGAYVEEQFVLNDFERHQYKYVFDGLQNWNMHTDLNVFQGEYDQTIKDGDADITLGIGYGITPFLKLKYMIQFIFQSTGYEFIYGEDFTFQPIGDEFLAGLNTLLKYEDDIVVVNNVADAIFSGKLDYSQLVPNVKVKEFIAYIEKIFGGKFIINEMSKTVTFNRYNEKLIANADVDLSNYLISNPKLGTPEFTQIKVVDKSIPLTSQADDSEKKITTIEFDSPKQVWRYAKFNSDDTSAVKFEFKLDMMIIGDVVHKNTSVQIGDNKIAEKTDSSSEIIFMFANVPSHDQKTDAVNARQVYYKTGNHLFTDVYNEFMPQHDKFTPSQVIESFYPEYKEFRLHSNIPIDVEMDIPEQILESLDFSLPKIVQGQKLMIESITQKLGKKDIQKVKFRTLRSYQ